MILPIIVPTHTSHTSSSGGGPDTWESVVAFCLMIALFVVGLGYLALWVFDLPAKVGPWGLGLLILYAFLGIVAVCAVADWIDYRIRLARWRAAQAHQPKQRRRRKA